MTVYVKGSAVDRIRGRMWAMGLLLLIGCMHFGAAVSFGQEPQPEVRLNTQNPLQGPGRLAERGNVVEKIIRSLRLGREDRWPVAVGLLQSMIDTCDSGGMYQIDERTYINKREFIHRVIEIKLPVEGRQAYRDMYGPLARKLLNKAAETLSAEQALGIANRFLNTVAGAEAAELAGDWLMNQGRYCEAVNAYRKLIHIRLGGVDPPPAVYAKLACCYGRMGRGSRILGLLRFARQETCVANVSLGKTTKTLTAVLEILAAESGAVRLGQVGEASLDWPTLGGASDRRHVMTESPISIQNLWSRKIIDGPRLNALSRRHRRSATPTRRPRLDILPVVSGDVAAVFRSGQVFCYDIYTGQVRWRYKIARRGGPPGVPDNFFYARGLRLEDSTVTISNGVVYYCGLMQTGSRDRQEARQQLMARDLATGKKVWDAIKANRKVKINDVPADEILRDMIFVGSPAVAGGGLYVVATADGDVQFLLKFDASNGELLWRQYLSTGISPSPVWFRIGRHSMVIPHSIMPSVSEGRVIVVCNNGLVFNLDAETGRPSWASRYESKVATPKFSRGRRVRRANTSLPRPISAPVIVAGCVIFLPLDSDKLHCFDITDGSRLWDPVPLKGADCLLGVRDGVAVVSGEKLVFIDLATGNNLRSIATPKMLGRAALTDKGVWYATKGSLVRVNLQTAKIDKRIEQLPGADADELGSLVFAQNRLLATSANRITVYFSFDDSYRELTRRLAAAERKAPLFLSRGKVCSGGQKFEKAIADYGQCLAIADPIKDKDTIYEAKRMLFETYLDYASNTKGPKSIEHLDKAVVYSPDVAHHVRLHLQYTDSFEKMCKYAEAVDHYRTMFIKWPGHHHHLTVGKHRPKVAIGRYAANRVGELIQTHGRTVYARYDREAESCCKKAMAIGNADAFRKVVDAYPNSKWKPLAWLGAGRFDFAAGKLDDAQMSFRRAETVSLSLQQKAEAIVGQFAVAEARGERPAYLRRARRILDELAELLAAKPEIRVPVAAGRKPALAWARALLATDRYRSIPSGAIQNDDPSRLAAIASDLLKTPPVWSDKSGSENLIQPVYFGDGCDMSIVLTCDTKGAISAFDVRSGKRLWQVMPPSSGAAFLYGYKVAVYDNLLVVCGRSLVSAYHLDKNGKLAWKHGVAKLDRNSYRKARGSTGNVFNLTAQYAFTPDAVVILVANGEVKALGVRSGRLRFKNKSKWGVSGEPAGNEDVIAYLTAGSKKLVVLDSVTGRQIFSVAGKRRNVVRRLGVACVDDENIWVEMDGWLRCYNTHKGGLVWEHRLPKAANVNASLVRVLGRNEDNLVIGTADAKVKVLEKRTGKVVWEQKCQLQDSNTGGYSIVALLSDTDVYMTVVRAGSRALSRASGGSGQQPMLYSYRLDTGKQNWKAPIFGKGTSSMGVRLLLAGEHLVTSVRSRVRQGRKLVVTDEVRMFDAATGKLNHTNTEISKCNLRSTAHRNVSICPGAQARGKTLILDGVKGPIAYRK